MLELVEGEHRNEWQQNKQPHPTQKYPHHLVTGFVGWSSIYIYVYIFFLGRTAWRSSVETLVIKEKETAKRADADTP